MPYRRWVPGDHFGQALGRWGCGAEIACAGLAAPGVAIGPAAEQLRAQVGASGPAP